MLYNHCMQINRNLYYWRSSLLNRLSSRTTHRIYQHRHEYHGNLKKTVTFARLRQTWPHSRSVTSQEIYLIWSPFKNPFKSLIRCILVPHKMLYTILVILLYKSEIKVQRAHITCFQRVNVYCLNGNFITSSDPARTTSYITLTGPRKARAIHTRDYNYEICRGPKIQGDFLLNNEKGPKMAQRYFACSE